MQQLFINKEPTPFYIVTVPEDANDMTVFTNAITFTTDSEKEIIIIKLGEWEPLGTCTRESMDEGVKELAEGIEEYKGIWIWKDFVKGKALNTWQESLRSLLQHNKIEFTEGNKFLILKNNDK